MGSRAESNHRAGYLITEFRVPWIVSTAVWPGPFPASCRWNSPYARLRPTIWDHWQPLGGMEGMTGLRYLARGIE
jgi:hypothetical protein